LLILISVKENLILNNIPVSVPAKTERPLIHQSALSAKTANPASALPEGCHLMFLFE
jgi:hypothetical protein